MAHWMLACKELNGTIYVTRIPQSIPPAQPGGQPEPGIPAVWQPVGPGLRPTIQHYPGGGPNDFLLSFEYLSHLVTRLIPNVDGTWPPAVVDPITTNPISIQLPEDGFAVKIQSSMMSAGPAYYFNPVQLAPSQLFFDPITNNYWVIITPAIGWAPLNAGGTVFYRVYHRPVTGGPWTLAMDWNTTLNFQDTHNGSLSFDYTATWGAGPNPANPNVNTDHNEAVIGGGTILSFDSTSSSQSLTYEVLGDDSLAIRIAGANATAFGDPTVSFNVLAGDDAISISKVNLEASANAQAAAMLDAQPSIFAESGDDSLTLTKTSFLASANAAAAGLY